MTISQWTYVQPDHDWCQSGRQFALLEDAANFVQQQRQQHQSTDVPDNQSTAALNAKQQRAFDIVRQHAETEGSAEPLRLLILGTAGTGKSYLINQLKRLLGHRLLVLAPTGVAAFNTSGQTLHSALSLSTGRTVRELRGETLKDIQNRLSTVDYLVIDEISMVGARLFGAVDARLRQAKPDAAGSTLGGLSLVAVGDLGQIPPVADKPLYATTVNSGGVSQQGRLAYLSITKCIFLEEVVRQEGDPAFRELLLRLRDGASTRADWCELMSRTPARADNAELFGDATLLHPAVADVDAANEEKLRQLQRPIANLNAVHSGPTSAARADSNQAGGLQRSVRLCEGARVMLTANLWTSQGLVNGAIGTIYRLAYLEGQHPPQLPAAVMVRFENYTGPTLEHGCVSVTPIQRTWYENGRLCSRLQVPLRLAWALTVHKCQGLTIAKAVINLGQREFATGLSFVALSRVRTIRDLLIHRTDFSRPEVKKLQRWLPTKFRRSLVAT